MATREIAQQFDALAPAYDATRTPLDPAILERMAGVLRARRLQRILEVGVGTGRIAGPLSAHGFRITGADVSNGMLAGARGRGLVRLVRASGYRLPFARATFDAVLFVHVLHVLDDPRRALREAVRVAREGAVGLVHPTPPGDSSRSDEAEDDPRRLVYDLLAEDGYPVRRGRGGPAVLERRLLASVPPDELVVIGEREGEEPLARRLDFLDRGASRHLLGIPPERVEAAVARARARVGDRTVRFHRVEALAFWRRAPPDVGAENLPAEPP